jgi:hypothetical protein
LSTTITPDRHAAQEQLLEGIRQSQQVVIDAVRAFADAAAKATPAVALPEPPADLPKPAEVVADAFDFAERLLASQRDFAEQLVAVVPEPDKPGKPAKPAKPGTKS